MIRAKSDGGRRFDLDEKAGEVGIAEEAGLVIRVEPGRIILRDSIC